MLEGVGVLLARLFCQPPGILALGTREQRSHEGPGGALCLRTTEVGLEPGQHLLPLRGELLDDADLPLVERGCDGHALPRWECYFSHWVQPLHLPSHFLRPRPLVVPQSGSRVGFRREVARQDGAITPTSDEVRLPEGAVPP